MVCHQLHGYNAFHRMGDPTEFLDTITTRESVILRQLYEGAVRPFDMPGNTCAVLQGLTFVHLGMFLLFGQCRRLQSVTQLAAYDPKRTFNVAVLRRRAAPSAATVC